MALWRLVSRLPRGIVFWSLTILEGFVYAIGLWAIIWLLLDELLHSSQGVQGVGEAVALLLGVALAVDQARDREGWGHRVVPDYRLRRRFRSTRAA